MLLNKVVKKDGQVEEMWKKVFAKIFLKDKKIRVRKEKLECQKQVKK